jgi:hypothetical protein
MCALRSLACKPARVDPTPSAGEALCLVCLEGACSRLSELVGYAVDLDRHHASTLQTKSSARPLSLKNHSFVFTRTISGLTSNRTVSGLGPRESPGRPQSPVDSTGGRNAGQPRPPAGSRWGVKPRLATRSRAKSTAVRRNGTTPSSSGGTSAASYIGSYPFTG